VHLLVLSDSPLDLVLLSGDGLHFLDGLLSLLEPLFNWSEFVGILLGHLHGILQEVHPISTLLVEASVSLLKSSHLTFNSPPLSRIG